jgi:hypothetical protein
MNKRELNAFCDRVWGRAQSNDSQGEGFAFFHWKCWKESDPELTDGFYLMNQDLRSWKGLQEHYQWLDGRCARVFYGQ